MLNYLKRKSILQFILFATLLISNWFFLFIFSKYMNKYSKLYHLKETYQHYAQYSAKMEESSIHAQIELEKWLNLTHHHHKLPLFNRLLNSSQPKPMCIGILSKSRQGSKYNYVNQAIMSLLTKTPLKLDRQIKMIAFNTDETNQNHHLLNMKHLIKIVNISANASLTSKPRLKEALDYALALEYLHREMCEYSLVIEDDALIAHNWYRSLTNGLEFIKRNHNETNLLYVKLFTGYKFFDWNWLSLPLMVLKVCLYSLLLLGLNMIVEIKFLKLKFNTPLKSSCLLVNSFGVCVFFYTISVAPCGFGVRPYSTGFGTVSLLIPHAKLLMLARHLQSINYGYLNGSVKEFNAKDIVMDIFKDENKWYEFIIEPSLVQHIGMHSSLYVREETSWAYRQMYKSFSWMDSKELIEFDLNNFN